jgi:hypothetical protein
VPDIPELAHGICPVCEGDWGRIRFLSESRSILDKGRPFDFVAEQVAQVIRGAHVDFSAQDFRQFALHLDYVQEGGNMVGIIFEKQVHVAIESKVLGEYRPE